MVKCRITAGKGPSNGATSGATPAADGAPLGNCLSFRTAVPAGGGREEEVGRPQAAGRQLAPLSNLHSRLMSRKRKSGEGKKEEEEGKNGGG